MAHHKPSKVAQLGRRVFGVEATDDRSAAIEAVAQMRAFFSAVLRMPLTMKALGVDEPDIDELVSRLHAHKGDELGSYYRLTPADTRQIYELMLDESQRASLAEKEAVSGQMSA